MKIQEFDALTGGNSLPATTFTYGDDMHLTKADNGYGGIVEFTYEIWYDLNGTQRVDARGAVQDIDSDCASNGNDPGWDAVGGTTVDCNNDRVRMDGSNPMEAETMLAASHAYPGSAYYIFLDKVTLEDNADGSVQYSFVYNYGQVQGITTTITGGVLNDYEEILLLPAEVNRAEVHVRCVNDDNKDCYLENEFKAIPLTTKYRVTQRKAYDEDKIAEAIISTYSYDGATTNTSQISDWVDTAHTSGNGDDDLKSARYGDFRGHSFVSTTNPDGVVTINYFHQDDYKKGTAYSTLSMTRDFHEPFEDGLAWSNYSSDWERTSASTVYPKYVDGDTAIKMSDSNNGWNYLQRKTDALQDGEVFLLRFMVESGALALTLDAAGTDYLQIRFGNNASLEHKLDVDCDPTALCAYT